MPRPWLPHNGAHLPLTPANYRCERADQGHGLGRVITWRVMDAQADDGAKKYAPTSVKKAPPTRPHAGYATNPSTTPTQTETTTTPGNPTTSTHGQHTHNTPKTPPTSGTHTEGATGNAATNNTPKRTPSEPQPATGGDRGVRIVNKKTCGHLGR